MLVSAILAACAAKLLWNPEEVTPPTLVTRGAELVVRTLPAGVPVSTALAQRAAELEVGLSLWRPDGTPIANPAGHPPPDIQRAFEWFGRPGRGGFSLRLSDGRFLRLSDARQHRHHRLWPFLLAMTLVLLGLGLATHPVARRITRRLEALQHGVERLGEGELGSRVAVRGRDEVARLAQAFNHTAERIEALVGQQQRMLASASHELRAPLARLRMALELLLDDETALASHQRATLLADTSADIEELDSLVADLLMAARLAHPERPVPKQAVDLAELLRNECRRVDATSEITPCNVMGDPTMLRRLVRNLLDNAAKYGGPQPPHVVLSDTRGAEAVGPDHPAGGEVTLQVCDRGPGVPEPERERIFEPFYRPQGHAESRDGGVGLGLSLVRQIAQHHGGHVRCHPREGGGSCFEVTLG